MSKFTLVRNEKDVGILHRISDKPRFKGIFKERFSDFHVNEIDLDGKIVQLTKLDPPPERKSEIDENDDEINEWIPELERNNLKDLQRKLQEAVEANKAKTDPIWKERVHIKVTHLGKDERTKIHKWISNFDQLSSETVEKDGDKFIVAVFDNKHNRNRRRPATRARYTHCTMYKEGVDTSEAIGTICKKLRIKPNYITFCGTKDKHGKTTQRICINNVDAHRIFQISRELRSIKLGNYDYLPHHLRLGDLKGNHFKILLRNVQATDDDMIRSSIECLKTHGFINYFGLQRFGSYEVSTHAVGKSILKNNWMEAFDLILKPKGNDPDFMKLAKDEWFKNRDPNAAIAKFPHWHRSIESTLLHGLAKYYSKKDFVGVFLRIPRNVRHLYIHSLQSYLWNQMASFRIEKMGLKPVPGDLVFVDKDKDLSDFYVQDLDQDTQPDDDDTLNPPTVDAPKNPPRQTALVKTLTEEDLPNYTIFDVLIPIHGTQITIPEDSLTRNFYDELLKLEGLEQDCFLKFKPAADQPKGAYRKLVVLPQNVSHKIIPYNDSDNVDSFIPSELDRLKEQEQKKNGTEKRENGDNDGEENKEIREAVNDKKCVIIEFSLPSSSYATMALREVLLTDSELESPSIVSESTKRENPDENEAENPDSKKMKLDSNDMNQQRE